MDDAWVRLAVVVAHLRGQPLNGELQARQTRYRRTCTTAPLYRLYALLGGGNLAKPGLLRQPPGRPG